MKGLPETHVTNCKDKSFSLNRTLKLRDKFIVSFFMTNFDSVFISGFRFVILGLPLGISDPSLHPEGTRRILSFVRVQDKSDRNMHLVIL